MAKKEKPSTKLCKHCKTEIPFEAKVCPNCRKKVKRGAFTWILLALVAVIVVSCVARGGEDSEGTKKVGEVGQSTAPSASSDASAQGTKPTERETEPAQAEYHVGDILQDGNTRIVYMSSGEYHEENQYSQPEEGYKYIYLQFAFLNTSDQFDAHISFYSFNGYVDGYAVEKYYGGEEELSATLSAGRATSGYVYFTVPEDTEYMEVEYETNAFALDKILFLYEGEQNSGYVLETNAAATPGACAVGDVVESSQLKITYLSCREYISDNPFIQPKDGFHFITCEFEFENLGKADEFISSWDFDCYADGVSCNGSYSRDDDLSATLSAGRKGKGTVTFEVPVDAVVVEVEYLSNYWTSNRVVFTADIPEAN